MKGRRSEIFFYSLSSRYMISMGDGDGKKEGQAEFFTISSYGFPELHQREPREIASLSLIFFSNQIRGN